MNDNQRMAKEWFFSLRNNLVDTLEKIDGNKFGFKDWEHSGSGVEPWAVLEVKL